MQEMWGWALGWENPLQEERAAHSSILAWRIPWTEEPGGLQSMGSQRVRPNIATKTTMQALGCGMWDMTWAPCIGSMEYSALDHREVPLFAVLICYQNILNYVWDLMCDLHYVTVGQCCSIDICSPFVLLIHSLFPSRKVSAPFLPGSCFQRTLSVFLCSNWFYFWQWAGFKTWVYLRQWGKLLMGVWPPDRISNAIRSSLIALILFLLHCIK